MAAMARAGQAGTPWTAATYAPLAVLTAIQLEHFNDLITAHRYAISRWIQSEQYFSFQKFFSEVIYKTKNIDIRYAYCIGLGSIMGWDLPRKRLEENAQYEERMVNLREERIMQFVVFQTWVDLLNAKPGWPTLITPANIVIQEANFTDNDMVVDKLFYESLGYTTAIFPHCEDQLRMNAPRTFMYAMPGATIERIAGMHGNAFAFPKPKSADANPHGGIRLFVQGNVVNAHGKWEAAIKQRQAQSYVSQQDGTWIYKRIANEYVGRSVNSICRPSHWVYLPENLRFLSKLWCYWRPDQDGDFQLIDLETYWERTDDHYSFEKPRTSGKDIKSDELHWEQNTNAKESPYIMGTKRELKNRLTVDGEKIPWNPSLDPPR